ncbi:MAG: F0F1 ATP synthase subunit A [Candidatus Magasanikbacteria bacterium]|jgi:F-type H+-transporting ATPase subunit a|nr:F0F1 ATP synthase subunit A [Candidatus Magasanikbacteria bacterium]
MWFQYSSDPAPVKPETLFEIFGMPISNAMLLGIIATIILTVLAVVVRKKAKLVPSKFQTAVEVAIEGFYGLTSQILNSKETGKKMLPLIGTIFVFFGFSNVMALFPGVTSFTYDGVTMFRTPTNDFNMTFSVALGIILLTQYASMQTVGFFGHLGKFFKIKGVFTGFRQGIGKGFLGLIDFILGLFDIIAELAKVFSLSLRLFGNMYAGEIMAGVLLGAFALVVPSVWLGFNLFVAVLQAMVFGALTAAYYSLAVTKPEEVEE